jgi:hypothetical protein
LKTGFTENRLGIAIPILTLPNGRNPPSIEKPLGNQHSATATSSLACFCFDGLPGHAPLG